MLQHLTNPKQKNCKGVQMSKDIYTHIHHIIPRHAGGTDDPSNLIELTVEEHAEAHRLLFEQYGRWEDELAWKSLSGHIGKEEIIKEKLSQAGKKSSGKYKAKSEEWKQKMSDIKKGVPRPEFQGDNHPRYGSQEQSDIMSGLNSTLLECPHCGKTMNVGLAKRWHFDNCKYKVDDGNNKS